MAVVVNGGTVGGISLIDPVTETTMGPFLSGLLGPASSLLDCVVTPDGTTAIVSNFSAQRLFFIDVRTLPPVLLGSVALSIPAEDLALTPNGRFVLVTDGGGSVGFFTPVVVSVDVASRTVVGQFTSFGFFGAQSVAVARDNRTVVIADFDGGLIVPLRLLSNGSFDMEGGTGTISFNRPANVALAPDGRTGVVCNLSGRSVEIISINGAARTVSQAGSVGGLPGGQQGAVFTPDGTKVLVLSALPGPDQLAILQVEASGAISDTGQRVTLPSDATEAFLGVDVMAVTPEGTKAYIGNPGPGVVTQGVTVVDLTTTTPVVRGMIPMPTPVAIAFSQVGR
jgi:DNA-binding beta-propeller fold protein YncE